MIIYIMNFLLLITSHIMRCMPLECFSNSGSSRSQICSGISDSRHVDVNCQGTLRRGGALALEEANSHSTDEDTGTSHQ